MVTWKDNMDPASIEFQDEMPNGNGRKRAAILSPCTTIKTLSCFVTKYFNHSHLSYDLILKSSVGEDIYLDVNSDKTLRDVGFSFDEEKKNIVKIIPKITAPSIVISPANKAEDKTYEEEKSSIDDPVDILMSDVGKKEILIEENTEKKGQEPKTRCYVGLVNQAMTCYLNSLLQALFMTPEFRNSLYKWEYVGSEQETSKSIPYQLQRLFLSLQTSTRCAVETSKLTKSFGWDASDSWQQHDIQELCRVMFDALEQKFKDTDQAEFINSLYQGKLIDYVMCLECKTEKKRVDTFLDIPLPVRPFGSNKAYKNIKEAMNAFIQPETLDGNNQYHCETCGKKCDAHKGLKFSHFPYILTLHLKRFDFDYNAMTRIKLTDRVEFPYTLNINAYLCEEEKCSFDSTTGSGPVAEGPSLPANDETKADDASITDSTSMGDDEVCQGAGNMLSSTSDSNSSESNVDVQDDDEGIDVSNGSSNQDEHEKREINIEADAPPGPFIYELFAIMIHSGSASGGHYYAYIKDFDNGGWFCFDDQSVNKITSEDISMMYGNERQRGYYSGAHSSSTNAYMLMYRQIDKEKNQRAMRVDEFPPHIKELVRKMKEEEEEDLIFRQRDRDRLKIKLFCSYPDISSSREKKLVIDPDTTLAEATAIAHDLFCLSGKVPLDLCRLVSYDSTNESVGVSFEDRDGEHMSEIMASVHQSFACHLLLEVREEGVPFEPYRSGSVNIKVFLINMKTQEVDSPVEVKTQRTTAIKEIRPKIAKALKLSADIKIMMEEYDMGPRVLHDDDTLQSAGFYTSNKIFVAEVAESDLESDFVKRMSAIIERFKNTITVYCIAYDDALDGCKLTISDCEPVRDCSVSPLFLSKGMSQGTSPQLPLPESEEECLGTTVLSDQSTSEDSSLTDSDKTIVGCDADYSCADLLCENSSSSGSDRPFVTSANELEPLPVMRNKKQDKEEDGANDDSQTSEFYLKIQPCVLHGKEVIRIQVDQRQSMDTLKAGLARRMGCSSESLRFFRQGRNNLLPLPSDSLRHLCDDECLVVRLYRPGEIWGKVFQLFAEDKPIKYLFDWTLLEDMQVGEAKRKILNEMKRKYDVDIPFDRCRLRLKRWKSPGKILLDSMSFKDLALSPLWELFVQELNGPENVTSSSQTTLILMRFSSSNRRIGDFHEITLETPSFDELRETLSEITKIPLDSLQFARPVANFPQVKPSSEWDSTCNCRLEDGTVLYYRNKDECGSFEHKEIVWSGNIRSLSRKSRSENDVISPEVIGDNEWGLNGYSHKLSSASQIDEDQHGSSVSTSNRRKDGKALRIVVSPTSNSGKESSMGGD